MLLVILNFFGVITSFGFVIRNITDMEMQASNLFLAKVCSIIADINLQNFSYDPHTDCFLADLVS